MQYNDWRHLCVVEGRIIPLSPTEYTLFMLLYRRAVQVQQGEFPDGFVSFDEMASCFDYDVSHRCLTRHMSNVRSKVEASTSFHIGCDDTLGYILVARVPERLLIEQRKRYKKEQQVPSELAYVV